MKHIHFIEGALSKYRQRWKCILNVGYVDLRLGNLCNLKNVECANLGQVIQWTKEWNTTTSMMEQTYHDEERTRLEHMDWPQMKKHGKT